MKLVTGKIVAGWLDVGYCTVVGGVWQFQIILDISGHSHNLPKLHETP